MSKNNYHNISLEEIIKIFNSDKENGLNQKQVKLFEEKYGKNKLPDEERLSKLKLFFRQFKSPLIYILVVAGIVTLFLKEYSESIIIFIIIFVNTLIGFFQENKTSEILQSLKKMVKVKAFVLRNGEEKEIQQEDLVPGDIIFLNAGDKVPADGRIIEFFDLRINEMALSGEWLPAKKISEDLPLEVPLADRDNMVYMGTIIEKGKAKVIVTGTGINTEIGKIAFKLKRVIEEKTPYQVKLEEFSKILAVIILFLSFFIFILGLSKGESVSNMFLTSVAVAVAALPEGLPIIITLVFTFGMRELLNKQGLIRRLVAAETLGSTSVICTDKTGTLTEAKMEVRGIYTIEGEILNDKKNYQEKKDIINGSASHILALKIAILRSEAFIENLERPMKEWITRGRPTDKALFLAAVQAGLDKKDLLKKEKLINELPFESDNKYSVGLYDLNEKEDILYVMGAPEKILSMSQFLELNIKKQKNINFKIMEELKEKYFSLTSQGFRVISIGYKKIPKGKLFKDLKNINKNEEKQIIYEKNLKDINFVGFIYLHDPLRKKAKEAIKICREAGMKPIIITGDHKLTAKAIAMELDFNIQEENILEGSELDNLSDEEFYKVFDKIQIYARTEPRHKIKIIEAWQKRGEVVAMTGDGVNDALALKKANIGIALGSGTDVAKESSDLILLTDDFEVIVVAVEEGRKIIDNVRKIITYLLVGGFTELTLIAMTLIFRLPLPVLPGQILWKNIIESTPPSFALTFEPKEEDVMKRNPEPLNLPLLTNQMKVFIFAIGIITNLVLFGIFIWLLELGYPIEKVRTVIFAGLAFDSFFFVFSFRNFKKNIWQYKFFSNYYLFFAVVLGLFLLLIAIYTPFFQNLLKTVPIGRFEWLILLGFGILNLILIEATKFYFILKSKKSI